MGHCEKCGVHVVGDAAFCPLCQGPLTGGTAGEGNVYPEIPLPARPYRLVFRLCVLVSVAAAVLCGAVLLCFPAYSPVAFSCLGGLASGWLTVGIAVKKRGAPLKSVFMQICILSLIVLAWDYGTGFRGWSLDFVLPILYLCTMLALSVIARLLHLRPADYLLYLVLNVLLGLVPLCLLLAGALRVIYPAVICSAVSIVFLAGLILFQGSGLKKELLRRLHL